MNPLLPLLLLRSLPMLNQQLLQDHQTMRVMSSHPHLPQWREEDTSADMASSVIERMRRIGMRRLTQEILTIPCPTILNHHQELLSVHTEHLVTGGIHCISNN